MVDEISRRKSGEGFKYYDTICRSVANRIPKIKEFAEGHDVILFVCGAKSSNGKILFEECRAVNKCSYLISQIEEIDMSVLAGKERIGICGATSTPRWLMNKVKSYIEERLG